MHSNWSVLFWNIWWVLLPTGQDKNLRRKFAHILTSLSFLDITRVRRMLQEQSSLIWTWPFKIKMLQPSLLPLKKSQHMFSTSCRLKHATPHLLYESNNMSDLETGCAAPVRVEPSSRVMRQSRLVKAFWTHSHLPFLCPCQALNDQMLFTQWLKESCDKNVVFKAWHFWWQQFVQWSFD